MNFAHPYILLLLILIPAFIAWYIFRGRKLDPSLRMSNIAPLKKISKGIRPKLRHLLFGLRMAALALLIIALARPQDTNSWRKDSVEGIDIVMALDISTSMLAMDLQPNRIEAAKDVAQKFINNRPNDNIGMVIFSGESYTLCPMTTDHSILLNRMREVEPGMLEDGTAIGMGLATAINRIKDSKAKSKVIILLTDGVNNTGEISPKMAANLAKTFGIRIYTIGVGTRGEAPYPMPTPFGTRVQNIPVDLDEPTLKEVAQIADGQYYRAVDNKSLDKVYDSIDKLEKSKVISKNFTNYEDLYLPWLLLAFALLLLEFVLRHTYLRSTP